MFPVKRISIALIIVATVIAAVGKPGALAQSKRVPTSALCVDVGRLKSGKTMRGAILHQDADGSPTMAVSREWLRQTYPDVFSKLLADEAVIQRKAWEQLRDRLKRELEAPSEPKLTFLLKMEVERVEKLLAQPEAAEPPQFIWLDIARKTIDKVSRATETRQRVAVWAWSERLANVESREENDLSRELKELGVDLSIPPPDLSERFPPRLQDDREWSARLALAAYAVGEPLDFQGTGDMLVEAKASRDEQDMAPIMAKLLSQQVGSLLNDLLGENSAPAGKAAAPDAWFKPAQREAEQKKARAFRATRVDLNPNGRQAAVQSVFVVRLSDGNWETIWSDRETQDASKERTEIEARITNDPQVKSALGAITSLGVASEDQFREAIRFGAATMAAQQSVDGRFAAFRDSMLKRLDGPPLWWGAEK